jgi:galactokinase
LTEPRLASAPARVTLLGEHVDHQGGTVLPVAVNLRTQVTYTPQDVWSFSSEGHEPGGDWIRYIEGVLAVLREEDVRLHPGQVSIRSTIPEGKGLSSSAALQVAFAGAICDLPALELARLCRRAESEQVGVPCGLMDQATSACAIAANVFALDCDAESFFHIPMEGAVLLLVDPELPRRVAETPYARRREEAATEGTDAHRHVIEERERVDEGIACLDRNDLKGLGALMTESHASLRDLYRCSHPTLDGIVHEIIRVPGVFGAKLVGAGWGGCVVALAEVGTQLEGTQLLVPDDGLYRMEA